MLEWVVRGGTDVIQEKLKAKGWDGESSIASIALTQDEEGKIVGAQVILSGFREMGRISANTVWGESLRQEDYIKVHPLDLALATIRERMVSDWIHSDQLDWVLKIMNKETKKFRIVDKLAGEDLREKGASKFSVRTHLTLEKGPKLSLRVGLAPSDDITSVIGNGAMNFPLIQIGRPSTLEISPPEPADGGWGLGFTPFIINMGDPNSPLPSMTDIHCAVRDLMNNACKTKFNTKFSTWKATAALGSWDPVDPPHYWPSRNQVRDEITEEGEESLDRT